MKAADREKIRAEAIMEMLEESAEVYRKAQKALEVPHVHLIAAEEKLIAIAAMLRREIEPRYVLPKELRTPRRGGRP